MPWVAGHNNRLGIEFPKRSTTEKFMIDFDGVRSPVFDAMEDDPGMLSPGSPGVQRETIIEANKVPDKFNHNEKVYQKNEISSQEVKMIRNTINILRDIISHAQTPQDLKSMPIHPRASDFL